MTPMPLETARDGIRELAEVETELIAGGLNPQPLPPRYLFSAITSRFGWAMLNPQPLPPKELFRL